MARTTTTAWSPASWRSFERIGEHYSRPFWRPRGSCSPSQRTTSPFPRSCRWETRRSWAARWCPSTPCPAWSAGPSASYRRNSRGTCCLGCPRTSPIGSLYSGPGREGTWKTTSMTIGRDSGSFSTAATAARISSRNSSAT